MVITSYQRHIQLAGASNLRDIGGYQTADGRLVRWHRVYRSGALFRFTPSCWEWAVRQNILTVCDLRSREERELAPTLWQGAEHTRHIGEEYDAQLLFAQGAGNGGVGLNEMHDSLYALFPTLLGPSFKAMFHALMGRQVPLIVHCSAGQDRTGLAIGLLLELLGVSREDIFRDYHLSTQSRRIENELDHQQIRANADNNVFARFYAAILDKRESAALKPRVLLNRKGQPLLLDAFTAIETRWGSIPAYLDEVLGIGAAQVTRLRDNCLVSRSEYVLDS
ncbi:tyrosine-protein phosphatase [Pseudomonas putida]|uniref:tyrosine-protein phosphatase n=1 Tax=Pseudomonas putida TaxID=303 RepID=UPI0023640A41|nr:tyrosine-protein phosphatase [Pseudomonas putida]MDD2068718.1 tyrosine-protein phosphatase [Pseudomonas putida]HDS1738651.1 tyrosine-protein phosphatase [Pseudomonas putida]